MRSLGDLDTAAQLIEEGLDLIRREDHGWDLAVAFLSLGNVRMAQGRLSESMALFQESAAIFRSIPDPWTLISVLRQLAVTSNRQGQHRQSEQYWRECLLAGRPTDDTWYMSLAMDAMGKVSLERGNYPGAVRLFAAAEVARLASGRPALSSPPTNFEAPDAAIAQLRTTLGEATFRTLWLEGQTLSREDGIALALSVTEPGHDVRRPTGDMLITK
jgi:hypothetical protein